MRSVNPFVGLFVAMATLMAAFFVPVFVLPIDHGERLAAIEARMDGFEARMDRLETRMDRLEARMDDLEAAIAVLNGRMTRIEGTVAGALGRPFPERMAERPDNLDNIDNPGSEG